MPNKVEYCGGASAIEEIAARARKCLKLESVSGSAVGVRLRKAIQDMGGRISVVDVPDLPDGLTGSLLVKSAQDFEIFLYPFTSSLRDNFTLAHELGHYVLHCDFGVATGSPVVFHRYGTDKDEVQANRFAAALLMPDDDFRKICEQYKGNPYSIAGHFDVSCTAAGVRAQCLGITIEE